MASPGGWRQDAKSHPELEGEDSKDRWSLQDVCSGPSMLRTCVRSSQNKRSGVSLGEERVDRLLQLLPKRLVLEPAVLVEPGRRMPDGDLAVHHPRTDCGEYFAQLGLGPNGTEGPRARTDDRDRLVPKRV